MNESYTADQRSYSSLRELDFRPAYYSDDTNLLKEFYVPALSASTTYDRVAGFFSSNTLAIAARGISRFIENGGRIRLVTSVVLSESDQQAIKAALQRREREVLEEIEDLEEELKRHHIRALGWMLKRDLLELKIAVIPNGIEHRKSGIMKDASGDVICFTGSDNETAHGWLHHDEHFHVYCSWKTGDVPHLTPEVEQFERLWNDETNRVRVFEPSEAFRLGLIQTAPQNDAEFAELSSAMMDAALLDDSRARDTAGRRPMKLFEHQEAAIKAWLGNNKRGIFEMATGTGKTFAALAALNEVARTERPLVAVIACPRTHLVLQWRKELAKFGVQADKEITAFSEQAGWKDELAEALIEASLGRADLTIVLTTHSSCSLADFGDIVRDNKGDTKMMIIGDEVHGLGAPETKRGLLDQYDYRLGLSATPRRWFDEEGTDALFGYFGETVFEFTLEDAINTINPATGYTYLTPYRYELRPVQLTEDECEAYASITRQLVVLIGRDESKAREALNLLRFRRADIVKAAEGKLGVLDAILAELPTPVRWTLVYTGHQQINDVIRKLNNLGWTAHRFTEKESAEKREYLLEQFAVCTFQVLVAMKCLDEGVDVPPARFAVLMASSANPREYIQRIGRVIRRHGGKREAVIYDMIVAPGLSRLPGELKKIEESVLDRELDRCEEIARTALNNADALAALQRLRSRVKGIRE